MNKILKKALCSFLVVVMCLTMAPLQGFTELELPDFEIGNLFSTTAKAATEGYYTYTVENGEATITDFDEAISGDITIPSTLGGYPVTFIGGGAFSICENIESIIIPDSVTTIGYYAFSYCRSLKTIIIPDSVSTIYGGVFEGCTSLVSITIPSSVEFFDSTGCESIESIIVDKNNKYYSCDDFGVLFNNSKTELIKYPGRNSRSTYSIPDSVTNIRVCAFFESTSLENIAIPDSVSNIESTAFSACNSLKCITIPYSVTNIDNYAFDYCDALEQITILNPACEIYDSAFTINFTATIYGYTGSTAHEYAIKYNREFVPLDGYHSHSYVADTTEPTCDNMGYTTYTCDCGDTYVADEISALGHDMGDWIATKSATCTEKGEETKYCSRCEYTETRETAIKEHEDKDNDGYCDDEDCNENICTHSETSLVGATSATCVADGYSGDYVCDKCGITTETGNVIGMLGHDMGDWLETKPATCTEKGEETMYCSRCEYTETRETAMKEHEDKDNDGYCDNEDCNENICAHSEISLVGATVATCVADGYSGDYVCDKCGITTETGNVIGMLGHDMGDWLETKPATCTEKGEETKYCSRCEYTETRKTAIKEHEDKDNDGYCDDEDCKENICTHSASTLVGATAATCLTDGYSGDYVCDICSSVAIKGNVIKALGHQMGNWSVIKTATCTENGEEVRYCYRCEYSEMRELTKTSHNDGDNDGYCDDCGTDELYGGSSCLNCFLRFIRMLKQFIKDIVAFFRSIGDLT